MIGRILAEGVVVECQVAAGPDSTLLWMAYRPNVSKGSREPGWIERMRWAGRQPYAAYLFRVTDNDNDRVYTFIIPKPCGNLSLMCRARGKCSWSSGSLHKMAYPGTPPGVSARSGRIRS